eukprot:1444517-Amphidinium_carterae.1
MGVRFWSGDISGRFDGTADVVVKACRQLGITKSGRESLVHGTEVVPMALVRDLPGRLCPRGEVSEYQLVL